MYFRLSNMPCGFKEQERVCPSGEECGVGQIKHFYLIVLVFSPLWLSAQSPDTVYLGVATLDAEPLIELAHRDSQVIVIDSWLSDNRHFGGIEDSISLPGEQTSCTSLTKITTDKSRPLVFYCNGEHCEHSLEAIKVAQQNHFKNLFWFQGGFQKRRAKDYPYLVV